MEEERRTEEGTGAEEAVREQAPGKKHRVLKAALFILLSLVLIFAGAVFLYARDKYKRLGQEEESFERSDVYVNSTETASPSRTAGSAAESAAVSEETEEETEITTEKAAEKETSAEESAGGAAEKNFTTIMLYGVDARNNTDLERNANADSAIICVIDNDTCEVTLVSVLRDMLVETPSGYRTKLTDVYAGYGVKESLGTINKCLDLSITQYATVNWTAVATAVNALGGIDVELTEAEIAYINKNNDGMAKRVGIPSDPIEYVGDGVYHINGVHAVMHAANRTVGMHDISRAERQRTILQAMLRQAKTCSLSQLNDTINAVLPYVSTNLTLTEILTMALHVMNYDITETGMFPFSYVNESNLTTAYVYCNTLESNVTELHRVLYGTENYVPSSQVSAVSAFIEAYRSEHP